MRVFVFVTLLISLIACRSEVNVSVEADQNVEQASEWPIIQAEVEDIFTHYEAIADDRLSFLEDRLAAKKGGKWGVIDRQNRLYYPFEFDTIVSNRMSVALRRNGLYMVYDTSRTLIAELRSDQLTPILDNFYTSARNGKFALINPNGMEILDHRFEAITGPKDESYFLGKTEKGWMAYDMAGQPVDSTGKAVQSVKWLENYSVALKSYGPLKLGMTKEQIEKNVGWKLNELYVDEFCSMYNLGDDFLDVQLMINNSIGESMTLERIYIFDEQIKTKSRIGIGSTEKQVIDAYGSKIQAEKNKYDERAKDLFYVPTDRKDKAYRLNFLLQNGEITRYSVGRLPSINFVEGCL